MLNNEQALTIFKKSHALMEGHFKLTSGLHSGQYVQCAQVLQYPQYTAQLCQALAEKFKDTEIDLVAGPAIGGIIVAYETARSLNVRSIFTERQEGKMTLRRGFSLKPGERVLVVEDVITTGGSVQEVIEVIKESQAFPVGVGVLVDRSGGKADFGLKTESLLQLEIKTYQEEACPFCRGNIPFIKPGSRK